MNRRNTCAVILGIILLFTSASFASQSCGTALLIIDVQMDLLAFGGSRLQTVYNQPILESVESIVAAFRETNVPIIYSKYASGAMAATPEMVRIPASITPRERDFVLARADVDPIDGALEALMEEEGISRLIICGLYSTCCVDNAVRAADGLGYEVIVIREGHGDFEGNLDNARSIQVQWRELDHVSVIKLADLDLDSLCNL